MWGHRTTGGEDSILSPFSLIKSPKIVRFVISESDSLKECVGVEGVETETNGGETEAGDVMIERIVSITSALVGETGPMVSGNGECEFEVVTIQVVIVVEVENVVSVFVHML